MSLVGFRGKNHPQQVRRAGSRDDTDDRRTPAALFDPIHDQYRFTVDAEATQANTKVSRFFEDGLTASWKGERVWCNPPYSQIGAWVEKAFREAPGAPVIALLLPANRTEQAWWQDFVEPVRDRVGSGWTTRFLRGRQRFDRPGWTKPKKGDRPPFGLVLLTWRQHAIECDLEDGCAC